MTRYVLKFRCFRTDKVVMVHDGFRTRRQAYQYRDASYGWGPGRFVVSPYYSKT